MTNPAASVVYNGRLYIARKDSDEVHVFDVSTYAYEGSFGNVEKSDADVGIAAGDGYILVLDDNPDEIEIFEAYPLFTHVGTVNIGADLSSSE